MFEIDVATQYLFPRWRRLSLSIISLIAVLVVTLVVWLILTFFSVTTSLEKGWMDKLVTLASPVRISPTEDYFRTSYYLLDSISDAADYSTRTLQERALNRKVLYNAAIDAEVPPDWISTHSDLLDEVFDTIADVKKSVHDLSTSFYEVASVTLNLHMKRVVDGEVEDVGLTQALYALSFDETNSNFAKTLLEPSKLVPEAGGTYKLPTVKGRGKGVLLPKQYRDVGASLGDKGFISYEMVTLTSKQEVKHPIFVAGFYDPGLLGMGGKFLLTDQKLLSLIRSQTHQDGIPGSEGIALRFNDLDQAEKVKQELVAAFAQKGLSPYFKVESFRDFEFVRPLLQELTSQKNLFTVLSFLILVVACSNIISLLIILVHDKKKEIAIMRALGASSASIAFIFAFSGLLIGVAGSVLGVGATLITLHFIPDILDFLSWMQGFSAFNTFFGAGKLQIQLSKESLFWVIGMTSVLSLLSGLVPAVKACLLKPSEALKSE